MSTSEILIARSRAFRIALTGAVTAAVAFAVCWQLGFPILQPAVHVAGEVWVVDVAASFDEQGAEEWWFAGGRAAQLPEEHPAHLLRKNPNDRSDLTDATAGADYFLEDPYVPLTVNCGWRSDGSLLPVTLPEAPRAVREILYDIDGDLWVDNHQYLRLALWGADNVDVTFRVRGDIHIADDVLGGRSNAAVTFVALPRADGSGGDIVLDDAAFGTLRTVDANLWASGEVREGRVSRGLTIRGVSVHR